MIFHELYSAYYNAVAAVITRVLAGEKEEKTLREAASSYAFGESAMTIVPALKEGKWQLLTGELDTPIRHPPVMPLTLLQKRWLKAVSLDPRVKLFDVDFSFLGDTQPLFTAEDYRIYDRYADGDPFTDEDYIRHFRTALAAVKNKTPLYLEMVSGRGKRITLRGIPSHLEYSEKDDKFRILFSRSDGGGVVNLARVSRLRPYTGARRLRPVPPSRLLTAVLTVENERNAPERVLLHFAHFEKRVERLPDGRLRLFLKYDREDETELVMRVLSFGPMVKVEEPGSLLSAIKERLIAQKRCKIK